MTNEQLVIRIKAGENTAENMLQLYEQNRGMIYQVAKKYSGYAEMDDLMQEGYLALCDAVEHYNVEQDALFITYAGYWIKQRMQRYIDNYCHSVRLPIGVQTDIRKYNKVVKEYLREYSHEPSDIELCRKLFVTGEELQVLKKNADMLRIRSFSEPISGEEENISLADSVASEYDLEEECARRMDREQLEHDVKEAIRDLPEEQQKIIQYRYFDGKTLKETGQKLGIRAEQVRQMEAKAMRKMREPKRCEKLQGYHEQYLSAAPVYHIGVEKFQRTWTSSVEVEVFGW